VNDDPNLISITDSNGNTYLPVDTSRRSGTPRTRSPGQPETDPAFSPASPQNRTIFAVRHQERAPHPKTGMSRTTMTRAEY